MLCGQLNTSNNCLMLGLELELCAELPLFAGHLLHRSWLYPFLYLCPRFPPHYPTNTERDPSTSRSVTSYWPDVSVPASSFHGCCGSANGALRKTCSRVRRHPEALRRRAA